MTDELLTCRLFSGCRFLQRNLTRHSYPIAFGARGAFAIERSETELKERLRAEKTADAGTELLAAKQQLPDMLQLLFEGIPEYAIIVLDTAGHIATWNPAAELLKGYSAQAIVGTLLHPLSPEDVAVGLSFSDNGHLSFSTAVQHADVWHRETVRHEIPQLRFHKKFEKLNRQDEEVFAEASELALLRFEQCMADQRTSRLEHSISTSLDPPIL